jgi:hypothetical protein
VETPALETSQHVDAKIALVAIGKDHEPFAGIAAFSQLRTDSQRRCASNNPHGLAINCERPGFPRRLRPNTDYAAASIAGSLPLLADNGFQR